MSSNNRACFQDTIENMSMKLATKLIRKKIRMMTENHHINIFRENVMNAIKGFLWKRLDGEGREVSRYQTEVPLKISKHSAKAMLAQGAQIQLKIFNYALNRFSDAALEQAWIRDRGFYKNPLELHWSWSWY